MIVTFNWIKDLLETKATPEDIALTLTKAGIEVEEVIDARSTLEPFIVAEIESAKPHPSIRKLSVCQVVTEEDKRIQVVCGASNAREGIKAVLAPIGSSIPSNGMLIEPRTIGGEKSFGMLCSADELMLEKHFQNQDGIIEMPADAKVGSKLLNYFELDDVTFHLNVTPNRGDCLSIHGLARELAAAEVGSLRDWQISAEMPKLQKAAMPEECSMFSLWHIKDICNLKTPDWIARRLSSANIALINAPVDIVSYVAHTFGQPMHVYDAETLKGNKLPQIKKRKGYRFNALDGNSYNIEQEALSVVCDDEVIALAGIIGSESTKVTAQTRHILLESASFRAEQIAKTGQALKLATQARHRFERGVDTNLCIKAAQIAVKMILDICKGHLNFAECKVNKSLNSDSRKITFNSASIKQILGFDVPKARLKLNSLGFKVEAQNDFWNVEVPSWRSDVCIKEDLIAEIGRAYGYENIPLKPIAQNRIAYKSDENLIRELCLRLGYYEVISWSFYSKKQAEKFALESSIELENPISQEMSHMRESIVPNMLEIWQKNRARGARGISIFEIGPVFHNTEKLTLALLKAGQINEVSPHSPAQNADIFDIKGDIQQIFNCTGQEVKFERTRLPSCHPHKCAAIKFAGKQVGHLGTLMPSHKGPEVSFAEIYLSEIAFAQSAHKSEWKVCNYQAVQRDFAFLIDKENELGPILSAVKNSDPEIIKEVALFDIFQGEGIPESKKSFAISCVFQSSSGTLSEKEIVELQTKVISLVVQTFGAEPRI